MNKRLLTLALLLGSTFFPNATNAASSAPLPEGKDGKFAVPKISTPPVINGTINPEEWREALAIGGLATQNPGGNQLIMRPTTFFLAWDKENIYVACRTWIMPGYKPRVKGRAPGSATAFDDGMEFNLRPMGANLPEGVTSDNSYKFFITCFGSDGDFGRVSVGQIFRNWRPHFKTAVRQTEPGTAPWGGSWWEAEMVFPAKDFELTGPNRAGDVWKMLMAFNHIPGFTQNAVPLNSSYFDSSGWPTMTLVENTPAVQVTMDELPGFKDGIAAAKVSVFNPTQAAVSVTVLAQVEEWKDEKTAEDLLKKETVLTIDPGKTGEFTLNEKLPRDLSGKKAGVFFHITQGENTLYRYYAYLTAGYPEKWVKFTPSSEPFPVSVKFNPVRNNLLFDADINFLEKPELARKVRYSITREADAKELLKGEITTAKYNVFESLLQMPELKPGDYSVEAVIDLEDGTLLGPVRQKFQKLDESKVFADWWKNKIGDVDRVIPPFTPLSVNGSKVGVWGRSYSLDALGLPSTITSQDKPVMAAAARIVAVINGKEQTIDLGGKVNITGHKPWKVSFEGEAAGAGLKFSTKGSVEQDGLVQIRLTYAPAGKEPVKVDSLRIEFPLADDEAKAMNSMGPGGNFATVSAFVFTESKIGTLWSTLEPGAGGSGMIVGSFYPNIWIGNDQRGLLWWADSDEGWVPDDKIPAHEVVREKLAGDAASVVLRNNIIGSPFELTTARTLTFTYNATPFKPFPKGWRATINAEDGTFAGPHKQYTDTVTGRKFDGTQWLSAPAAPEDWSRVWGEFKVKADAKVHETQPFDPLAARRSHWVHNSLAIMSYGSLTADEKTAAYFIPEWDENTFGETQTDYILWLAKRAFTEGGLRSIYWDIFFVQKWEKEINGMAYKLPDGRLQPTFNGLNLRRLSMRLASLQNDLGLAPGGVTVHSTNCFPFVAFPWVGAGLDGEWTFMTDASTRDWVDNYPPERMRALNTPQNYGVPLTWMSINQITDPVKRGKVWRGFYDWVRFHDTTWYGWDGYKPGAKLLDWGLNDERLQYVPHWRNTAITSSDPKVLVAYWQLPGRVFVMAFNHDGTAVKDAVLKVDFEKLDLNVKGAVPTVSELRGVDTINGQSQKGELDPTPVLDASAGTVTVAALQPHTARYFGIRVENPADLARIRKEFTTIAVEPTAEMLDWGLVSKETAFVSTGAKAGITNSDPGVKVALFQQPDRVLVAVTNSTEKPQTVVLDVDLDKLGLTPKLTWQEFVGVRDFDGGKSKLDFHAHKLDVGTIQPGGMRLLGLRRY